MTENITQRGLIIEDDLAWQEIISETFSDCGIGIDIASNLDDAIHRIQEKSHRVATIDLSLDSANHNNHDGLNVLRVLNEKDPGCFAILLTGYATVEIAVSAITDYHALSCLRKESFDRAQFEEIIRRAINSPPQLVQEPSGIRSMDYEQQRDFPNIENQPQNNECILIVEDDAGWRNIISEIIKSIGFQAHACGGFGEALGKLRRKKYALAVIDLSLSSPKLFQKENTQDQKWEGIRLIDITKATRIPTIVLTGIASHEEIEHIYNEHEVHICLEKQNFNRDLFISAVMDALKAQEPIKQFSDLTTREWEVFNLLAKGATNKEIAEQLCITSNTVKRHLKSIFEKLEIHNRSAAVALFNQVTGTTSPKILL